MFVIAILGILGGGLVSVGGWLQIKQLRKLPDPQLMFHELNGNVSPAESSLDQRNEVALWIQTIMYTLLAILSLFGSVTQFTTSKSKIMH